MSYRGTYVLNNLLLHTLKKKWAMKDIGSIIQELSSWNNKDKDIEWR